MAAYDFRFLSWFDFEELSRDLLQVELGIRLESFKPGRDQGIDFRHAPSEDATIIVQAKHRVGSGYTKLRAAMKKEAKKLPELKPDRYILTTSVGLTPANKTELAGILAPFVTSDADIIGQDDLNNLLGLHPEIEQRHFKLWLTSTNVLQVVLNHATFVRSRALQASLESKLKIYVQNSSYPKALEVLDEDHAVIIAGAPGIGKSLLAEMLIVRFIANGYEPVSISGDIEEGFDVWGETKRQIFYYDDFLGQTDRLEKLGKNEDSRLAQFVHLVHNSHDKRLILTTREYILEQARLTYERLDATVKDMSKIIVDLSDYSHRERARILYNHLYFSGLSDSAIGSVVADRKYMQIIRHPTYSPRIIESVTRLYERTEQQHSFGQHMVDALNEPGAIWAHAFENQLQPASQCTLFTLASLPREVTLEDLNEAFVAHHVAREGHAPAPDALRKALRVLDGNFTRVSRVRARSQEAETVVQLQNPSILDFLLSRLNDNVVEVERVIEGAVFYFQVLGLMSRAAEAAAPGGSSARFPAIRKWCLSQLPTVIAALERTMDSGSPRIRLGIEPPDWSGRAQLPRVSRIHDPLELRLASAAQVFRELELDRRETDAFMTGALDAVADRWSTGRGNREASAVLLEALGFDRMWGDWIDENEAVIRDWFLPEELEADEYLVLATVRDLLPFMRDAVEERTSLPDEVEGAVYSLIDSAMDSSTLDELEEAVGGASELAEAWDFDLYAALDGSGYEARKTELAQEEYEPDEDEYRWGGASGGGIGSDAAEIDGMFDSLSERSDL
jgi:hypothetical protein